MTHEKIQQLWQKSLEFPVVFDDITYGNYEYFMRTLSDRSNLFFEIGDGAGLVCISNVRVGVDGLLHFIMYDRKLKGKETIIKQIIAHVFDTVKLRRMSSSVPSDRETAFNFLHRLGFKVEGKMRQAFPRGGAFLDTIIFGMLREEL